MLWLEILIAKITLTLKKIEVTDLKENTTTNYNSIHKAARALDILIRFFNKVKGKAKSL
jgi:FtsZ-binding cell division protein ZapB